MKEKINALPFKQKMVIQLRDIERYDFETIAKILDMKEDFGLKLKRFQILVLLHHLDI